MIWARALVEVERPRIDADLSLLDDCLRRLRTEGITSTGVKLAVSTGKSLLVCIDPLEEVLDSGCEEAARAEFLQMIFSLRPVQGHDFRLVCALRADFMSHLLDYPEAAHRLKGRVHMLSPMGRDELERIIEEPALARGVRYEQGLVPQIAEDAGGGSSLPLLEWALFEMWRHQQGRTIALSDYRRIGGVPGALARHADEAYQRLIDQFGFNQTQVWNLLLTLVRASPAPTRRPVLYTDLTPQQRAVASILVNERLLTCRTDDQHRDVLEIAHESLLSQWRQLAGWIADDRRFLDWHTRARDHASSLLPESEVAEAREWLVRRRADIDVSVQQLIERSRTHYEEQVRRLEESREKAEAAARMSEALRLAFLSENVGQARGTSSSAAIALAIESLLKAPTVQGDVALRKALAQAAQTVTLLSGEGVINEVTYSPDGTLIAAARADGYLFAFSDDGEVSWKRKNFGAANSVSFSPDSKWVACGHHSGIVLVLSSNYGKERCRLPHEDAVNIVRFSPDGSVIATACDDGTARLYDAATSRKLHQFKHAGSVNAIAFSPGGDALGTGCDDGTARLYGVASGTLRHSIAHPGPVTAIAFSPDGELVVTACGDGMARAYETITGTKQWDFPHGDPVKAVAFSHDGSFIAMAGGRPNVGVMRVIGVAGGREVITKKDNDLLTSVSFSHDDSLVATASRGGLVRLFHPMDGSDYSTISHEGPVVSTAFSPDRIRFVTAGSDEKTLISGRVIGDERLRVPHNRRVTSMAFSPDERLLASSSAGGPVMLSDWTTGTIIRELPQHSTVNSVSISQDTKWLATADDDGRARLYKASTGARRADIRHDGPVRAVAFSPDGKWLGTGSGDRMARSAQVASPKNGKLLRHPGPVNALAFSPNCRLIATACGGPDSTGLAQVFEISSGSLISSVRHGGWVNWVTFSPDGRWIATASDDGTARLVDPKTGEERCHIGHDRRVGHVAFGPDGRWIATASDDGTARVFDSETGDERSVLTHDGWVNWVAFSSDGRWIATASDDGTARVFDLETGIECNRLVHRRGVNIVAFSPDNQWIATASDDGTARVSAIAMDLLLNIARERMTRPLSPKESRQFGLTEPAQTKRVPADRLQGHRDKPADLPRSQRRQMWLSLNWYRVADFAVVEIVGEVDVYTAPRIRECLISLGNRGNHQIILDLEGVEFLDSTGLGVFVGGLKRARAHDGTVSIVCTQERILKIFRITGQIKVFEVFDSVDAATAHMSTGGS